MKISVAALLSFGLAAVIHAETYVIPVVTARMKDATYTTTTGFRNDATSDVECTARYVRENGHVLTSVYTVKAGVKLVEPDTLLEAAAVGSMRLSCSGPLTIVSRIQASKDDGRTFDAGRLFVAGALRSAVTPAKSRRMQVGGDIGSVRSGLAIHAVGSARDLGWRLASSVRAGERPGTRPPWAGSPQQHLPDDRVANAAQQSASHQDRPALPQSTLPVRGAVMTFTWLNKQGVQNDRGFVVQRTGRFTAEYRDQGKVVTLDVEDGTLHGQPCIIVNPDAFEHWDSEAARISAGEQKQMFDNLREAMEFQGLKLAIERGVKPD